VRARDRASPLHLQPLKREAGTTCATIWAKAAFISCISASQWLYVAVEKNKKKKKIEIRNERTKCILCTARHFFHRIWAATSSRSLRGKFSARFSFFSRVLIGFATLRHINRSTLISSVHVHSLPPFFPGRHRRCYAWR
jgi:hypothetical protein